MSFEFYALPDEQRLWLSSLILQEGIWCWIDWNTTEGGRGFELIRNENDIKKFLLKLCMNMA